MSSAVNALKLIEGKLLLGTRRRLLGKAVVTEHVYVTVGITGYLDPSDAVSEALSGQSC